MSFPHTHTPIKPTCPPKYVVPTRPHHGATEYYLTPELEEIFCKLFPTTLNTKIMEMFGISHSTLHRFARQYHLTKDMSVIRHKQAQLAKKICEKNGYYDSLRGKPVSDACRQANQEYLHSERYKHPLQAIKEKNPWRYRAMMKKKSKARKHQLAIDKMRLDAGLTPHTHVHIPFIPYTRKQTSMRYGLLKFGYITGSKWDADGERMNIYYDTETERHPLKERNAEKLGFRILPL